MKSVEIDCVVPSMVDVDVLLAAFDMDADVNVGDMIVGVESYDEIDASVVDVCSELNTEEVVSTLVICGNNEIDVETIGIELEACLVVSASIVVENEALVSNNV